MKNNIHWCKQRKMWTSHTYKFCAKSKVILIDGHWSVEKKPNKKENPRGWVFTDHKNVIIDPSEETILNLEVKQQLLYDKREVTFNIEEGNLLLFNELGCYVVEKIK